MIKHVKTIGSYSIVQELDDDRFYYDVMVEGYKVVDTFTSQEQAEKFIEECLC